MRVSTRYTVAFLAISAGLLFATGCQATADRGTSGVAATSETRNGTQLPELSLLYREATAPRHRAVRKPFQDDQTRHMRMLAEKAAELAEQTRSWDSDTRLMSMAEPQRDPTRVAVRDFRDSLQALRAAAEKADLAAVRSEYGRTIASYQNVLDLSGGR
jgi:hypothetical protein